MSNFYKSKQKRPFITEKSLMVELVANSLHLYEAELMRWQPIIGERYYQYKAEKGRNSLAHKP